MSHTLPESPLWLGDSAIGQVLSASIGRRGKGQCSQLLGSVVADKQNDKGRGDANREQNAEHSELPYQ